MRAPDEALYREAVASGTVWPAGHETLSRLAGCTWAWPRGDTVRLVDVLDQGLLRLWPRRVAQELLLDLGERKGWGPDERRAAVDSLASWCQSALGLPDEVVPRSDVLRIDGLAWARGRDGSAGTRLGRAGVAGWAQDLGPVLGVGAKALANGVAGGLRPDRPEHRWLQLIARLSGGLPDARTATFHGRSHISVSNDLARLACTELPDAADATLMNSLVSLWQRRRPPSEARGNRGVASARREMPLPVAALPTLVSRGQLLALLDSGSRFGSEVARALGTLMVEAALTSAHLAPHPARKPAAVATGEDLLEAALRVVAAPWFDPEERALFVFRVDLMRAYRDRREPAWPDEAVRHPYVTASRLLWARGPLDDVPDVFVLRPQLAGRRGALTA